MKRRIIICGILVIVGAAGAIIWWNRRSNSRETYRTASVERGDVVQTVRVNGAVQPLKLVQVGTQVNGPVRKLHVDYNVQVKEGDLVAQIDPTVYEARLAQDEASLLQSQAQIEKTEADLNHAEKELVRAQALAQRDMLTKAELDTAIANRDGLLAQQKISRAAMAQAQASLRLSRANLDYTTIRSPVSGVVVSRNVSEGQTVVANMSAQVLFSIATDLREIQVEASIPEADIGKLKVGQPVTFTVDAHEDTFTGAVSQIRLSSATIQNVVTYPVIVRAPNPALKLFPGMTATITCETDRHSDVMKVPNAALRFKPSTESRDVSPMTSGSRKSSRRPVQQVWRLKDGKNRLEPIPVETGITDGINTEVLKSPELRVGQEVVVGLQVAGAPANTPVNPFNMRSPRRR